MGFVVFVVFGVISVFGRGLGFLGFRFLAVIRVLVGCSFRVFRVIRVLVGFRGF